MKINLIQVLLAVSAILIVVCVISKFEPRRRTVPNVDFALNREINKSNPRKDELMHVFSNMEVPGWKWDKLYA
mgnify:CR=1 FL=1|jgi:hypothetical protein